MRYEKEVSVIFPAYNEEENIEFCVRRAHEALKGMLKSFEIIIVDDGSIDSTKAICEKLKAVLNSIKIISKAKNEGYGAAIRDGIRSAAYDLVFYSDSDGQFDIAEMKKLLEEIDSYDGVIGYRKERRDPLKRKIFSFGYNLLVRVLFGISVKDINCAFKLFYKKIFDKIDIESTSYVVNTEILAKAHALNFRIKEVAISHFPRHGGRSKVRLDDFRKTIEETGRLYRAMKS